MKERPILFSTEMVKAILDLEKTQTRRPIKPQLLSGRSIKKYGDGNEWVVYADYDPIVSLYRFKCPYGQVGDRLWVRETWCCDCHDPETMSHNDIDVCFKASVETQPASDFCTKWHPSIHMPRWASRINLEITNIRAERVQDISWEDIKQEGIDSNHDNYHNDICYFTSLWNSVYASRGYSFESNPWVFPIEFKVVTA